MDDPYFRRFAKKYGGFRDEDIDAFLSAQAIPFENKSRVSSSPTISLPSYLTKPQEDLTVGEANDLLTKTPTSPLFGDQSPKDMLIEKSKEGDPWQTFTNEAKTVAQQRGYPLSVLMGQAALETGRGTSEFARSRNNYFGYNAIDADPNQATSFSSPTESINTYIDLITKNPIYAQAWAQYQRDKDEEALIRNIHGAGYATDPDYASKVVNIPEFQQYRNKLQFQGGQYPF